MNKSGFTLLEVIVSLLIVGLMMQSISVIYSSYRQVNEIVEQDYRLNFLHFVTMLESELNYYQFDSIQYGRIYLRDKDHPSKIQYIAHDRQRIVKKPGTQIILYEVRHWNVYEAHQILFIEVEFLNGQQYFAQVALETQ